jgi:hypothetical protein
VNQPEPSRTALSTLNLPFFDGYPYLVVRLQPVFFHLSVLPTAWPVSKLKEVTRYQAQMNDLPASLVLARDSAFYFRPDGSEHQGDLPPCGGTIVEGLLSLTEVFPQTPELGVRQLRLSAFVNSLKQTGYVLGDTTKGGRKPNELETRNLSGRQQNGVPLGLTRCSRCGEWRGECIDPNPWLHGVVVPVHCLCENRNFCARCGGRMNQRKVNANYYSEQEDIVWHVPGFSALSHRCKGDHKWKA